MTGINRYEGGLHMSQNTAIGIVQQYAVMPAALPTKIRNILLDIVTTTMQEDTLACLSKYIK